MAIDQTQIGLVAANLMDRLEKDYGDKAELQHVMILAAVDIGDGALVRWSANEKMPGYVARGMLAEVQKRLQ